MSYLFKERGTAKTKKALAFWLVVFFEVLGVVRALQVLVFIFFGTSQQENSHTQRDTSLQHCNTASLATHKIKEASICYLVINLTLLHVKLDVLPQ